MRILIANDDGVYAPGLAALYDALAAIPRILEMSDFSLDELRYEYPDEPVPPGWSAQGWLEESVRRHAAMRYPDGVPAAVDALTRADAVLFASPVYRASFSGVLK